ncbi:hypothetical protein V6N13_043361 [Hibiscus sabdariffa]
MNGGLAADIQCERQVAKSGPRETSGGRRRDSSKRIVGIVGGSGNVGDECKEVLTVAAKGKVVVAQSGLQVDKHRVVNVVDSDRGV